MNVKNYFSDSSDQIFIEDLEISCYVGVPDEERAYPQPLHLSLLLDASLEKAGASDKIKDTVDYGAVMDGLRNLLQGQTFFLIEKVAETAANFVIKNFPFTQASIQVTKLSLPGVKSVTVSIHRKK